MGYWFYRTFFISFGNAYILPAGVYVSKWVEAILTRTNEAGVVVKFLRGNIFSRYVMPRAIISDQGTHFNNWSFDSLLRRYSIIHRLATLYHLQTSRQVEVANRQIKRILVKIVNNNRKDWADELINILRPYRMAFKTPLGMSPYRVVSGNPSHLPVELKHRA